MGATILVVDDDSAIRTFMRVALERAGYSVLVAADGEEGLHVFSQYQDRIALLLTDVTMPRMNGFAGPETGTREGTALQLLSNIHSC